MTEEQTLEQERLLEIWDWEDCYVFAREIDWANTKELEKRVLEIWDWYDCYHFARHVDWADKETLLARSRELWYDEGEIRELEEKLWIGQEKLKTIEIDWKKYLLTEIEQWQKSKH